MSRILATPNPAVLVWARTTAAMSIEEAATKAKVKPESLSSWEGGTSQPSIPQLRKLASAYRRPLAAFYLPEAPPRFQVIKDFRRLTAGQPSVENAPKLAYEIRRAHDRREWALELMAELEESPPVFDATAAADESIEVVALRLRKSLGVTIESQASWRTEAEAFKQWRTLLERAGILALQTTDLPWEEARGFSISMRPLPVVVVNRRDALRGRIFTMLHEMAHVMLNQGGVCDLHDENIEAFCNRVAGAALFPRDALLNHSVVRRHNKKDYSWTDVELQELSRQFGGSREAALVRLLTLGLTTQSYYKRMRIEFLRQYEQAQREKEVKAGAAPPHVMAVSSAGILFTSLVIESFNRDKITEIGRAHV